MSITVFDKVIEVNDILEFANRYKKESFMLSQDVFITKIIKKLGVNVGNCTNMTRLLKLAEEPFRHLTKDIIRMMIEDWVGQTKSNDKWGSDGTYSLEHLNQIDKHVNSSPPEGYNYRINYLHSNWVQATNMDQLVRLAQDTSTGMQLMCLPHGDAFVRDIISYMV